MEAQVDHGHYAPSVCRLAGITYRQLDYWVRTGLITPSQPAQGSGTQRLFSDQDIAEVRLISGLLKLGVSLQMIRRHGPFDVIKVYRDRLIDLELEAQRFCD